jgi:hypothetical protein
MNNITIKEVKEEDAVIIKQQQESKVMTEKEIITEAKKIDTEKVAKEILNWLIENVENYIENHTGTYLIDLILDKTSTSVINMEETKKLQSLYDSLLSLTDSLNINNKITLNQEYKEFDLSNNSQQLSASNILDTVVAEAHKKMKYQNDLSKKLFERMAYYYEFSGFFNGTLLIKKLSGGINITKFTYDTFSVNVKVRDVLTNNITKEYQIPEGFSLRLDIAFSPESTPTSLF